MTITNEEAEAMRQAARDHANDMRADIANTMNRIEYIRAVRLWEQAERLAATVDLLLANTESSVSLSV